MIKTHRSLLVLSLLLGGQTMAGVAAIQAGDFNLGNTRDDSKGVALDEGRFLPTHLVFTADARVGYDDNTLAEPDQVKQYFYDPVAMQKRSITRDENTSDSAFVNFDIGAAYTASSPRTKLSLGGDVGVNYYFDRPGRSYDVNGSFNLAFSYKLTPRAVLDVTSYNAYTSEPDFGASNGTGFTGENSSGPVAGVTSADRRNGDFFYTADRIALTYQFSPRISTVTGYDLVAFAYRDNNFATIEDRVENYFSEQFRYLVSPLVTAVAEYRFGYVDYFGVSNDSFLNFALVGAEFNLSQRLRGSFRTGVEFRNYLSYDNNNVSPYFEGNVTYDLTRLSHVNFIARYADEEGDISVQNSDTNTLRLGVAFDQAFGARLSAYVSFYYTNSEYHGNDTLLTTQVTNPTTGGTSTINAINAHGNTIVEYPGNFTENTFDVAAGLRYSLNRVISAEAGYTHTTVLSGLDFRQYDRNRYFGGVRFSF